MRTLVLLAVFVALATTADKDWYKNISPRSGRRSCRSSLGGGIGEFLAHLKTVPDGETTIDTSSSEGTSVTCKRGG